MRLRRTVVIAAIFAAGAFVLAKTAIDWRLRGLDQAAAPSPARMGALLDEANATEAEASQPREYTLPDDLVRALLAPGQFEVSRKVASVPETVRLAFAKAVREDSFAMADPDGEWEATDVIRAGKLPRRRLSAVATGAGLCLLFYERGGIGRNDNVAVFRRPGGGAEATWHAYLSHAVVTPSQLANALRDKSYREAPFF